MIILGVDPGVYGGMAFVHDDKDTAPIVFRMPMDGTGRHGYDLPSIMDIIFDLLPDVLVIEKVTRPASLVRWRGLFEGIGAALELETHTVRPQEWKKYYGLTKNKQESIDLALEHFPSLDTEITKISDDGLAEAVLIAEYGYVIGD